MSAIYIHVYTPFISKSLISHNTPQTSHTMGFTLYLLAKNPDTQRILQKEIDSVMGNSEKLLPEHIAKMPYLNYVLKESLR